MTLAAASAFAMPIYGEIQPFTGWMYILAGAIYTLTVFLGQWSRKAGPAIFSPQNTRPHARIVIVHLIFLSAFLACLWLETSNLSRLPAWMTAKVLLGRHGHNASLVDWLNLAVLLILRCAEMPLIYAPSQDESSLTRENPAGAAWMK